jgi:two-component system chemotaxis sensor kinase CheA
MGSAVDTRTPGDPERTRSQVRDACAGPGFAVLVLSFGHGIEDPAQRAAVGKREVGTIVIGARLQDQRLVVTIEDDGRGIEWTALAAKARQRGLPAATEAELVEALFADGVSTAAAVTEVSGRGVGMAATRQATVDMGGTVEVRSRAGLGTEVRFTLPLNAPRAGRRTTRTPVLAAN